MTEAAIRTVLCFGDSNTHGTQPMRHLGDVRRFGPAIRWTGYVRAVLPAGVDLIEEGHPGRTTVHDDPIEGDHKNGLKALPALLESHRPIDIVVLMLGTNDLKARFSVTAADIVRSLERLCDTVAGSTAGPGQRTPRLLMVCPPPIEETGCLAGMFEGGAAKSRAVGPILDGVAKARCLPFVDAGRHMAVSPLDGIHFDPEGHSALGKAIAAALLPMLD